MSARLLHTAGWSAMLLALATPVWAQQQPTPPEHYTLDARGVDLVTGSLAYQTTDVVIGDPAQGGLVHGRAFVNGGWRDTLSGTIAVSGSVYVVSLGAQSEIFTKSGSSFTPASNRGATLSQSGSTLTFTTSDGTVAEYSTIYSGSTTPYAANNAALMSVRRPNGERINFYWDGVSYCSLWDKAPIPTTRSAFATNGATLCAWKVSATTAVIRSTTATPPIFPPPTATI